MVMFKVIRIRKSVVFLVLAVLACAAPVCLWQIGGAVPVFSNDGNASDISDKAVMALVDSQLAVRNTAMLTGEVTAIKALYDTGVRNGLYAYEHEVKKTKYLGNWAQKQGIRFTSISSKTQKKWINSKKERITINFLASTTYTYEYENKSGVKHEMRIGTYHEMVIVKQDGDWIITREWYTDPFADSLNLENIQADDNRAYILSRTPDPKLELDGRRKKAVEYADRYCGAAGTAETGYAYNPKYKNYNSKGGDCANFVSQVLYEGGGFKKTGSWNYGKEGSKAWLNAQAFKNFLLSSQRGSLIAYGKYGEVLKSSYKLMPGDIVAYEKKGKVAHVSVVTGADASGYALVNCHNTDRYRVPWDLGWSDSGIRFYLIRVNY
jgi:hypothetical protein